MPTTRVNFITDATTKRRAEQVFKRLGISVSAGLNIYLHHVAYHGGIPFPLELPPNARGRKR